jgi:hypothetical protein
MALLSFEEIKALGLKKGDRVRFNNTRYGKPSEGVILAIRAKTVSGGKYFCGARNRWIDVGPIKKMYLSIQEDGRNYTTGEDEFHLLEKVVEEVVATPNYFVSIEGQSAEELVFNWSREDLYDFAKDLGIANRSKMNKHQLAMAIETEVSL